MKKKYFPCQLKTIFLFLILGSMFSMFEFLFLDRFVLKKILKMKRYSKLTWIFRGFFCSKLLTLNFILNSLSDWLLSSSGLWLDSKFCDAGTEFRRKRFKKIDIFWMKRKKWFQTWFKFGGYSQIRLEFSPRLQRREKLLNHYNLYKEND